MEIMNFLCSLAPNFLNCAKDKDIQILLAFYGSLPLSMLWDREDEKLHYEFTIDSYAFLITFHKLVQEGKVIPKVI